MANELKAFTVNLKSMDQNIDDPIVAGAGDANGRTFRVIFSQEAAAQLAPETKVYLSWYHQEQEIKGFNVFTKVSSDPVVWEIKYPQSMLKEGNVLACIQLVDKVSIVSSTNFIIHVLTDPNDGSNFVVSDDYSLFQSAVIELNCLAEQMKDQMEQQKIEFEDMQLGFREIQNTARDAVEIAERAEEKAEKAIKIAENACNCEGGNGGGSTSITVATEITLTEFQYRKGSFVAENMNIQFLRGESSKIDGKIQDGTITENDFVIASDTDELFFVNSDLEKTPMKSRSTQSYTVQLGENGSVGSLRTGDVIDAGIDLDELIMKLTQKRVPATYTAPGVTCSAKNSNAGTYEAGSEITTTLSGIFTQNDAGSIKSLSLFKSGESTAFASVSANSISEQQTFTIGDDTVNFYAVAEYNAGAVKNDNLGSASPEGAIEAGSEKSSNVQFKSARYGFYGTGVGDVPELTSSVIRGLGNTQKSKAQFSFTVAAGQQYIVIAMPSSFGKVAKIRYDEANDNAMLPNFVESVKAVEGANGYSAVNYNVYSYQLATPAASPMTFIVSF